MTAWTPTQIIQLAYERLAAQPEACTNGAMPTESSSSFGMGGTGAGLP